MSRSTPIQGRHCYRKRCRCTHTEPCDYGWIDMPRREHLGSTYAETMPCPTCRPELAETLTAEAIHRATNEARSAQP